jgi:Lrp/AsnC family transcriptional regulator for asnA, asnC and gidA
MSEIGNGGRRGRPESERELDAQDLAIIRLLQEDGRMSFPDIGTRLGVSANTVRARYNQLRERDAVKVVAFPDSSILNLGFHAVLGLTLRSGTAPRIAQALAGRSEIGWIGLMLTGFDIMFELALEDNAAFGAYKARLFEELPEITGIETFLVGTVTKFHYALGGETDRAPDAD